MLVLGSGAAGLAAALEAAAFAEVTVLTKAQPDASATAWAQGGVAAVLDPGDTFDDHIADTLRTGAGLCDPAVVESIITAGPGRIAALRQLGARFSESEGNASGMTAALALTREGGHSARRIVYMGDHTGQEIHRVLWDAVRAHPRIRLVSNVMAIDFIRANDGRSAARRMQGPVVGAYGLDEASGTVRTYLARATVVATGGAGKVYRYTSNPDVATGDGIAMAHRAGARIENMEFFQFHPTCLYHPQAKNFLISEALRGEGARLRLPSGEAFMERYDAAAELAPRDVVARAIDSELKRLGIDYVLLDITHKPASWLKARFPTIYARCLEFGIDIAREPIPVVPAAHYLCGGIQSSVDGQTHVPGLWAIGEAASTGLHGANRLASNSLLEGLVCAHLARQPLQAWLRTASQPRCAPPWDPGSAVASDEAVIVHHNWDELRLCMWNYVGIVRSAKRLERAKRRIDMLEQEIRAYYWAHLVTRDLLELRNIALIASLIVDCAARRRESRGLHYMADHPLPDAAYAAPTQARATPDP